MSDKFESIYGNEPTVVFSYNMTDRAMWQIRKQVWTLAYTEGITDGHVNERNRIVERLKDNLTPSVAETVIAIIYAA